LGWNVAAAVKNFFYLLAKDRMMQEKFAVLY
jgi:hypothetical protein